MESVQQIVGTMTRVENSQAMWALTAVVSVIGTLLTAVGALLIRAFKSMEAQLLLFDKAHKDHEALDNTRFESMRETIEDNASRVTARVEKFTDNVTATMGEVQLAAARIEARMPERRENDR